MENEGFALSKEKTCNLCGHKMILEKRNRRSSARFKCTNIKKINGKSKRMCSNNVSESNILRLNSFKCSSNIFFMILYYFCCKMTYRALSFELDISLKLIDKIVKFICSKAELYVLNSTSKIGGDGLTVEIDETHIYTRKFHLGRILKKEKIWVVGGICRMTTETFFQVVNQRNSTILKYIILNNVNDGSIIYTDMWLGILAFQIWALFMEW